MKKIFYVLPLIALLFLTGCMKSSGNDVKNKFIDKVNNLNSYYIEGNLMMTSNDENYQYDVKAAYQKEDNFKVTLQNKSNGYEQTILRNTDAVYVITPSLNKTFKFQSKWPYNNSQSYLLNSLAKDLEQDKDFTFEEKDNTYVLTTKVDYQNNPKLVKQNIILDKDYNLKKVEVLDENNTPHIEFIATSIDEKPNFKTDYFEINEQEIEEEKKRVEQTEEEQKESCTDDETCEDTQSTLDETLFPLYLPANTTLSNKEVINKDEGKRIIMTFNGDNPFILVQETVVPESELTIVPTYGEPFMLIDTIGSLTDISYTWVSNGVEYYIVSDVMNQTELLEIAKSINTVSTINEK